MHSIDWIFLKIQMKTMSQAWLMSLKEENLAQSMKAYSKSSLETFHSNSLVQGILPISFYLKKLKKLNAVKRNIYLKMMKM